MIAWWWVPILLVVGTCFGAILMGVCAANSACLYRDKKEGIDDD